MTTEASWAYCCVYPEFLRTTIHHLPEEPWTWLKEWRIYTTEAKEAEITDVIINSPHIHKWPINVIRDDVMRTYARNFPLALQHYVAESVGVKLMVPMFMPLPFFYTDDDVVIRHDPSYLLSAPHNGWSQSHLDQLGEKSVDVRLLSALHQAFDIEPDELTRDLFNARRTDAGVYIMHNLDPAAYVEALYKFFSTNIAEIIVAAPSKGRYRTLDQRVLSGLFHTTNGYVMKMPHYKPLFGKNPPVNIPKTTFIHYCASSNKWKYALWLRGEHFDRDAPTTPENRIPNEEPMYAQPEERCTHEFQTGEHEGELCTRASGHLGEHTGIELEDPEEVEAMQDILADDVPFEEDDNLDDDDEELYEDEDEAPQPEEFAAVFPSDHERG